MNILPKQYENDLENMVKEVPYFFHPNTSYAPDDPFRKHFEKLSQNGNIIENGQFTHPVFDDGQILSNQYGMIYPILYIFAEQIKLTVKQIHRIRINLLTQDKTFTEKNYNFPHSDAVGEHVFIYYVNDCDGDTILFNEFENETLPQEFTIKERISPQKGLGTFFECKRYHASSNPRTSQFRYIINFNFS